MLKQRTPDDGLVGDMPSGAGGTPALHFEAIPSPSAHEIEAVARVTPRAPFNTAAYAAACATLGASVSVLTLSAGTTLVAGCVGYIKGGRLSRRLEIMTAPRLAQPAAFWDGVRCFCHQQGVSELFIESFAAEGGGIPRLPGEMNRRQRFEFVLGLVEPDPLLRMSKHHRRNIKRATRTGLVVRRTREPEAVQVHLRLMQFSMQRRQRLGGSDSPHVAGPFMEALLRSGAAEIFQATVAEQVLSSSLILRARDGAYYQSAGTSSAGMSSGASPFLIAEVTRILKDEGLRVFNLGGAGNDTPGLWRFKAGFGADVVALEAASCSLVPTVQRPLRAAVRLIRRGPAQFLKTLYEG